MASGHVNRTQRPNTWLHRPSLQRENSPCQLGAVHTWPCADAPGGVQKAKIATAKPAVPVSRAVADKERVRARCSISAFDVDDGEKLIARHVAAQVFAHHQPGAVELEFRLTRHMGRDNDVAGLP